MQYCDLMVNALDRGSMIRVNTFRGDMLDWYHNAVSRKSNCPGLIVSSEEPILIARYDCPSSWLKSQES